MRDRFEEQLLAMIERFTERAALLGAAVRRLDRPGDDALGTLLRGIDAPARGGEVRPLAPGAMGAIVTPAGRREHAFGAIVFTDPARARASGLPVLGADEANRVLAALCRSAEDLQESGEAGLAVEEYCGYLTRSYENMAMIYRLVRSLGRIGSAREVVDLSLQNMVETLECDWAAVRFDHDTGRLGELSGGVFLASKTMDKDAVRERLDALLGRAGDAEHLVLTPERNAGVAAIIQPIRLRGQHAGRLVMSGKREGESDVSSFDTQLMEAVSACIGSLLETIRLYEEQAATFMGTLRAFSFSLDAKDRYTRGHSERVALLARDLALAAGLHAEDAERIHLAGVLHDIGKIGVPDRVLCKPGRLTDDEFGLIKRHPRLGYDILKPIPMVRDLLPGVLHHHERWDGRGYPDHLAGDAIPLMARILAIADTFDAMSSNRAYRPARSREEVIAEIERCAGTQLDPDLAPIFTRMDLAPFDAMIRRHSAELVNVQHIEHEAA